MLWIIWKHLCYLAIKYIKRCCKAYQSTYEAYESTQCDINQSITAKKNALKNIKALSVLLNN